MGLIAQGQDTVESWGLVLPSVGLGLVCVSCGADTECRNQRAGEVL